jgi:hypothetical protein
MKKIQTTSVILAAMFTLGALVGSASAEVTLLAEWLVGASSVTALTSVETIGKLLLTDLKAFGLTSGVDCNNMLVGSVGPDGEDEVTEVLNGLGEKTGTPLTGIPVHCTADTGSACEATTDIEVWPKGLPWLTLAYLMEGGPSLDVTTTESAEQVGWEVLCLVGTVNVADECTQASLASVLANEATDVLGTFSEEGTGSCTVSKEKSGDVEGEVLTATLNGQVLAGSLEGATLLAEWLINNTGVVTLTSVETTGKLLLTDLKAFGLTAGVDCVGAFVGSVGPSGEDEVTEVLNSAGEKTGTPLSGIPLHCTADTGSACEATTDIELWPLNLPWLSLAYLTEAGAFLDSAKSEAGTKVIGYEVLCLVGTVNVTDECTQASGTSILTNEATDVLGTFKEENTGNCTVSNEFSNDIEGNGLTVTLVSGQTLAISSE